MIASIAKWFSSGAWLPVGVSILAALLIVALAILAAKLLHVWMKRLRRHVGNSDAGNVFYVVEKIGGYIVIVVGLLAALSRLGLDLQSFSLFAGALGVGVGLGLQGIVKEFFSGLVLIFNPAMRVGDFIELEDGTRGEIVEIGTRSTRLRTNDYVNVLIPNSTMVQSRVTNWTYSEAPRRLRMPFSVSDQADKAKVRDVVLRAARKLPFTLPDTDVRKTQVWLEDFSHEGLSFELVVWPDPQSCRHPSAMTAAYMWAVHDALVAEGIASATPQLDLRVKRLFGREGEKALQALRQGDERPAPRVTQAPPAPHGPNDAAKAVFDDAERDLRRREEEPTRRPPPPPAGKDVTPRARSDNGGAAD
ncbi:MAG TPA: mechanosensitive ion channel domain-containing protein [Hyphomonadaceae bacterium]|nr:mechanosensitive ion channel domain-containing protein [Hyphomonadaceae bacterium]